MTGIALYQIAEQYESALRSLADLDLPEDVVADTLEALQGDLQVKAVNVAAFFQNLDAEADAIDAAVARLKARSAAIRKRSAGLREYLRANMERCGISQIKHELYTLSVRQNPEAVVVEDEASLPAEFVRVKEVRSPDKTAIKEAIRAGQAVPGARIERGTRLDVK